MKVLAAAAAATNACLAPHDLRHQAVDFATIGQKMPMAAVIAPHHVLTAIQSAKNTDGDGLLPDAGVCGARNFVSSEEIDEFFLEGADQFHLEIFCARRV